MSWITVWKKEMLDLLRDRKTWVASVVLPILLVPGLMLFIVALQTSSEKEARRHVPIAVEGRQAEVERAILQDGAMEVVHPPDPLQALRNGEIRAIVRIDGQFDQKMAGRRTAEVTIVYNPSNQKSQIAHEMLAQRLQDLNKRLTAERLSQLGLDEQAVTPLAVRSEDASTKNQKAGSLLGFIIPFLLVVSCATGAMPAATDLMAGEKERGTLEALMTTPMRGRDILIGKLGAVSIMAMVAALVSLLSMLVAMMGIPKVIGEGASLDFARSILSVFTPGRVTVVILMLALLAVLFAALMLTVSSYAKSFKESQTYMTPFVFVAMAAGYGVMFTAPNEIPFAYFFVPFLNAAALLKELLYGIVAPLHIGTVLFSLVVYVGASVAIASLSFRRESLVVRG